MFRMKRVFAALSVCLLLVISGGGFGTAQQQEGGSGLQITPTRTEMSILPGEQKPFSITVKNVTQGPTLVKTIFNDFTSDGVTGNPVIVIDPNREVPNSMKTFVKGLEDFNLNSGESKEVKLTIDMPADASPGGYYGVVRFAAVPQGQAAESDTQVSLTASVASLLFVEASGDITEQIQIDSIKVLSGDKASSIFIKEPNKAAIAITNKGNGFSKPFGRVTVSRGSTEVYAYEVNNSEPRGTVLPNSARTFTDEIKNVNKFGRYTITANISHGQGGEVIIQKASFWYVPIWVLVLAAVALVVLIVGAFATYKKLGKKRKK